MRSPVVRLELAAEQPQQHRLAGAVLADDADALAAQHGQVDAVEDRRAAELDADAVELDDALAAARVRAELERDLAPLEHGPVDLLHAVDLPLLVARLLDVPLVDDAARPVLEAPDRLLEPRDLLLLRDVQLLLALQLELARDRVRGVVAAATCGCAPPFELGDLGHGLVEQVAVVRDGDDRTVERAHQMLEPLARLDVEVRLGLVEQQHVGVAQEAGGEADELALAAGEDARRLGEVVVVEADVDEERAGTAVEARAAGARSSAASSVLLPAQQPRACGRGRRPARRAAARSVSSSRSSSSRSGRAARSVASASRSSPSSCCGRNATTRPRRWVTSPASATSSPARMRSSVDLPPPFGPITPMRTPGSTSKSSPSRISREPKLLAMPRAASSAMRASNA